LAKLAEARAKLEARAKERFEREMAEHRVKLAARDEKTAASGKKPGGRTPAPPLEGPQPKDQINLTDEDSRIIQWRAAGLNSATTRRRWWRPAPGEIDVISAARRCRSYPRSARTAWRQRAMRHPLTWDYLRLMSTPNHRRHFGALGATASGIKVSSGRRELLSGIDSGTTLSLGASLSV
jgi:hypothetical protein